MVRSWDGDIILPGVDQGEGFAGAEVEEARACLFGLRSAQEAAFKGWWWKEGDCLQIIQKLKLRKIQDNSVGFYVRDILNISNSFCFPSRSFVKRG